MINCCLQWNCIYSNMIEVDKYIDVTTTKNSNGSIWTLLFRKLFTWKTFCMWIFYHQPDQPNILLPHQSIPPYSFKSFLGYIAHVRYNFYIKTRHIFAIRSMQLYIDSIHMRISLYVYTIICINVYLRYYMPPLIYFRITSVADIRSLIGHHHTLNNIIYNP